MENLYFQPDKAGMILAKKVELVNRPNAEDRMSSLLTEGDNIQYSVQPQNHNLVNLYI